MALSVIEINSILNDFISKYKNWSAKSSQSPYDQISKERINVSKYPEYWTGYNYAASMYDAIKPHSRADIYPEHLFAVRAPNQTEEQARYIKANYKAITLGVFEDFKATISRAFADQNWSIRYSEEKDVRFGDETFQSYVNKEIENYGSIEAFAKSMIPSLKLVDANGIIAIYPTQINYTTIEESNELDDDIIDNELIRPLPRYYPCKSIVGQELGRWYLVISDEKTIIKSNNKDIKEGLILELFDDEYIYRIKQIGKKSDFRFGEVEIYFKHDLGYVPCIKLMGTPQLIDQTIAYQSPFITAIPLLEQALLDESYLQISKAGSAFPFMVALGEICEFTDREGNKCDNGRIFDSINGGFRTCQSCSGAGVKSRFSPSGALLVKPKTSMNDGDTGISGDYLKFVSPPMDTLNFLRSEIDSLLSKSRSILHLPSSDAAISIGESQTATGSLNKLRALHAFIKPISDQIFTIYEFVLETIGRMRYGEYFGGFNLVYPTSFDINTPSDYLALISEGQKAGVAPSITFANMYNYIKAINYTDEETTAIYDLILEADELLLMSSADIIARVANGSIEKWQDVLHYSAPQLIMYLIRNHIATPEAPRFIDLPMNDKVSLLKQLAVSKIVEQLDPIEQIRQDLLNGVN
jgi:hypothetical protein